MTVGYETSGAVDGKNVHVMLSSGTGGWSSDMVNFRMKVPLSVPLKALFSKSLERTGGAGRKKVR